MNRAEHEVLRLSSFQELIRRWELSHPYNFVCAADVVGAVNETSLRDAALVTLAEMRLGAMKFHGGRRYSYDPVTDVEVRRVSDIERNAEAELNRPFDDAAPLRIAYVQAGLASTVSITCRHLAFDGHSGSVVARRILLRAVGAPLPQLDIGRSQRGRHFLMDGYAWLNPQFFLRPLRDLWRMRSVYSRGPKGMKADVGIRFLRHDEHLLTRVRRVADAPGVTVNDALLARLSRGLIAIHEKEFTARRRTVCVSVAVSLRRGVAPLDRGIGVAAFPVFVTSDDDVIRVVRRQTDIEKRSRSYLRSLIGIGVAAAIWPARGSTSGSVRTAYVPTSGFSNLRVPSLPGDEHIRNVRGVVSTGPVLPMMLVAVTHGDELRLALTWQSARFESSEIDVLESTLTE